MMTPPLSEAKYHEFKAALKEDLMSTSACAADQNVHRITHDQLGEVLPHMEASRPVLVAGLIDSLGLLQNLTRQELSSGIL